MSLNWAEVNVELSWTRAEAATTPNQCQHTQSIRHQIWNGFLHRIWSGQVYTRFTKKRSAWALKELKLWVIKKATCVYWEPSPWAGHETREEPTKQRELQSLLDVKLPHVIHLIIIRLLHKNDAGYTLLFENIILHVEMGPLHPSPTSLLGWAFLCFHVTLHLI